MEENHKISKKDGEWVTEEEGKGGGGEGARRRSKTWRGDLGEREDI